MSYLFFVLLNLLGAMSPGPDFAIITRYALKGNRKEALKVSLGISIALIIQVSYCLLGVAVFLQDSPRLFCSLQVVGALYLLYLGIKMLQERAVVILSSSKNEENGDSKAFLQGFFTNLLNPKATLFILSLLSQFVSFDASWMQKLLYGVTIPFVAFGWFSFLSLALTHPKIYENLQSHQLVFIRLMGGLLIGLSLFIGYEALAQLAKI